jgi:sortase (surface protein transpeptidase)
MLLKIIVFVIVIFLVLRFFSRALFSMFLGNLTDKMSQAQNFRNDKSRQNEGDVIINSSRNNGKKYNTTEGEYVDFEEIKD